MKVYSRNSIQESFLKLYYIRRIPPTESTVSDSACFFLCPAHVCCDQMAECIKIPLGTEVGLGRGDFVLDGNPVLPPKKGAHPQFSAHVCCGRWMDQDASATWHGDRPRPSGIVLDGDPAPPLLKGGGHSSHPIFGPCLLWPKGCMYQDTT